MNYTTRTMPAVSPELLSDARILAAFLIFFGSYVVFAVGKCPWMKIDRPGAAIIGAVLMLACRIVGAREALTSIDFATIVLLFLSRCACGLSLAMSSTLAGNLTITGSVANIIVVERTAAEGVHVGFREYFRVGLPVTVATLRRDRCGSR